jgi:hypothetical protein
MPALGRDQVRRRRGCAVLLVSCLALWFSGSAAGEAGGSGPVLVSSPFWPSLIAVGSVPVGYDGEYDDGGVINTIGGERIGRIADADELERLSASGSAVVWVRNSLVGEDGPGEYADQVVLGSVSGTPRPRVVTSCQVYPGSHGAVAIEALGPSELVFGCTDSTSVTGSFATTRVVHVMALPGRTTRVLMADGPVIEMHISGNYLAVAVATPPGAPGVPPGIGSEEVEVFDLRSMQVVDRVIAADWIQAFAVSSTGTVAMIEGSTPAMLELLHIPYGGIDGAYDDAYGGEACPRPAPLVVAPVGAPSRVLDSGACPSVVQIAGARLIYARIEGRGAALMSSDEIGRRTVLRWLGRAHGVLSLDEVAATQNRVLYTEGTCRYSGGNVGVSAYTQMLAKVASPRRAAPVACPVIGRLPAHVMLPAGKGAKSFTVMIRCPRGCSNPEIRLGGVGDGTAPNAAPGRRVRLIVRMNDLLVGAPPPTTVIATLGSWDRTGRFITYATRTIRIRYCNATQPSCRRKLTP